MKSVNNTEYHQYNETQLKKLECEIENSAESPPAVGFCPWSWDGLLCWPPTAPNSVYIQHCFDEFWGLKYDSTKNASRECLPDSQWSKYTNYTQCVEIEPIVPEEVITIMIYAVGFSVSLIALFIAVWIFLFFKDLRCLRNTIHTNLMSTYILTDLVWIINYAIPVELQDDEFVCALLSFFLHFFHLTTFYWMFVEGLYLYMLVVETFTRENIKLRGYLAIGWGTPFVISSSLHLASFFVDKGNSGGPQESSAYNSSCLWGPSGWFQVIYQGAALLVLGINSLFLVMIMWVLITKLRSSTNAETQQSRKATKALLVLIPLFGITYILFLKGPTEGPYELPYSYLRAVLLSSQGFTVTLFYCFLNTEVQNTVRHHFSRWKESRNLGQRRYTYSKDWSPDTRTESIRLCLKNNKSQFKKRESLASDSTTLTIVGSCNSGRQSNGGVIPPHLKASASPYLEPPRENNV